MRVNLLLNNPGGVRSGYLNIDQFAPADDPHRMLGDVLVIDHAVDNGEAEEIVAHDVLNYVSGQAADLVLNGWLKKLAHGGTLTLSVVDVREVARGLLNGSLDIEGANTLLHGTQLQRWDLKQSSYTLSQVAEVLTNLGYEVLSKRLEDYRAVITVRRP